MTGTPYPVSGVVRDVDGSTVVENVTVTAFNNTTGEELSSNNQSTTNASGEYTIDLANFTSGYTNGDIIVVSASKRSTLGDEESSLKIQDYRTVVDTGEGYEEKDLTLTYIDALDLAQGLLISNWEQARTGGFTPQFLKIFDQKRLELNSSITEDSAVLVYRLQLQVIKNAIGTQSRRVHHPVSIDVRSAGSRTQAERVVREVDRIFNNNIIMAGSVNEWDICEPDFNWVDLSDKSSKIWRFVGQVQFEKLNESRERL